MTAKLIIGGETVYPSSHPKGKYYAAHEADREGYQFVAYAGSIYAIVRFANEKYDSLYLCECETDTTATLEIIADFNRINGIEVES